MPKVSIIVPGYNVEAYIGKCLDSLVNQTLKNIEIIVVNDGSTDGTQKVIDDYAKKYPKLIKSYKKENGGLSSARNFGIKQATGDYIGFVDSDDYVELNMYEKLYNKASEANFDIVACDVNIIYENRSEYASSLIEHDLYTKDEVKRQMINIYPVAWNKIYLKELFEKGITFKKNVWYEDVEFLYKLFPYISSIGVIKEPLINYVQSNSVITKTIDSRLYHYIDNWNGIIEYYKKNKLYDEYHDEIEYCYVRYLYNTFIIQATKYNKKDYNKAVKTAKENVKKQFPNYRKNKYFKHSLSGFYMKTLCFLSTNLLYYFTGIIRKTFIRH